MDKSEKIRELYRLDENKVGFVNENKWKSINYDQK